MHIAHDSSPKLVRRAAEWLATAYYLSWGFGMLGAAAAIGAAYLSKVPALRNLLYYLALISALTFAAFVSASFRRRLDARRNILNPHLRIQNCEATYVVTPDGLQMRDRTVYRALARVPLVSFDTRLTGSGTHSVVLTSEGELLGPVNREDRSYYQVVFPTPLSRGDSYTLEVERTVADPGRTMRPFVARSYSNSAGYGSLKMVVSFPQQRPSRVFHEEHHLDTGPLQEPVKELFLSSSGGVAVEVAQIKACYAYSISWSW